MSMRGKRFSPFVTDTAAGRTPYFSAASQLMAASGAPICAASFSMLSGMKGRRSVPHTRSVSSRL